MPANKDPIYVLTPNVGEVTMGATNNQRTDGNGTIGTDIFLLFSAGSNGSFIHRVRFKPILSSAGTGTNTAATSLHLFLSTVSSGATSSSNTSLIDDITAPAVSAGNSTSATPVFEIPLGIAVPSGMYLLVSQHVAPTANTAWQVVAFGGDY